MSDLNIRHPDPVGVRRTGTVRWFDEDRGQGRITADDGEVLFVHHVAILGEGHRKLCEGQRVSFIADGRVLAHHRHAATQVEVIADE